MWENWNTCSRLWQSGWNRREGCSSSTYIGDLVYMRNQVIGRSKIEDRWGTWAVCCDGTAIPRYSHVCSQAIYWWTGTDHQSRQSVACQNPAGGCQKRTTTSIRCTHATRTSLSRPRRILVGSACQHWSRTIISTSLSNNRLSTACDFWFMPLQYSSHRGYDFCPSSTEMLHLSKHGY